MITFHYYYYPTQLGIPGYNYKTTTLMITAKVAQVIFILCSGMNLSISYENNKENIDSFYRKQHHRICKLMFFALLISYVSFLLVGDSFVKFGILHFMAATALIHYRLVENTMYIYVCLIFALLITLLITLQLPLLKIVPKQIAFVFGLYNESYSSVDHFSIYPWSILYLLGIILGKTRYFMDISLGNSPIKTLLDNSLIPIGKYSLEIYMIHWVILYMYFSTR